MSMTRHRGDSKQAAPHAYAMPSWTSSLLYIGAAGSAAALLGALVDIAPAWAVAAMFLAWPIIGTFVTIDDDLPGGWANPDGDRLLPTETPIYWTNMLVGLVVVSLALLVDASSRISLGAGWPWIVLVPAAYVIAMLVRTLRIVRSFRDAASD